MNEHDLSLWLFGFFTGAAVVMGLAYCVLRSLLIALRRALRYADLARGKNLAGLPAGQAGADNQVPCDNGKDPARDSSREPPTKGPQ